jgi:hypothetical protein
MLNEPRLILHFETTNRTNFTNLAGVDACGAGQNLRNEQNFLDRIYKIYRIFLGLSIHYSPAWVDDRPEAYGT